MSKKGILMNFQILEQELFSMVRDKMPTHLEHLTWSKPQLREHQSHRLQQILTHAKQHTHYYQKVLHDIDTESFNLADLQQLPINTKQDTLDNWNDFVVDQVITRDKAEQHLKNFREGISDNPFYNDNYLLFATGGSSGLRGLFVWSITDFADFICQAYRYQIKDKKVDHDGMKLAVLVSPTWLHASLAVFYEHPNPAVEVKHFPATMPINQLMQELEQYQPDQIIGYSTIIVELSHFANAGQLHIKPSYVSTNSEPLDQAGRNSINKAWALEATNMWCSVEAGFMGSEDEQHKGMWITDDFCILESVDENLQPVANPGDAKKLLMTNLLNHSFPLIRYVIDDSVSINNTTDNTYRLAGDIRCRVTDWFIYHENIKINPMTFCLPLEEYEEIHGFQVQQTPSGAVINLVSNVALDLAAIKESIQHALEESGLKNAKIEVKQLAEIARHDETGKIKRFIAC